MTPFSKRHQKILARVYSQVINPARGPPKDKLVELGIAALGVEAVQEPRIGKKGKGQMKYKGSTELKRLLSTWYNETNGSNKAPRGTTILDFLTSFDEDGNGEDGVDAGHEEVEGDDMYVGGDDDDDLEIPIVMEGYESPVICFRPPAVGSSLLQSLQARGIDLHERP